MSIALLLTKKEQDIIRKDKVVSVLHLKKNSLSGCLTKNINMIAVAHCDIVQKFPESYFEWSLL